MLKPNKQTKTNPTELHSYIGRKGSGRKERRERGRVRGEGKRKGGKNSPNVLSSVIHMNKDLIGMSKILNQT